MIWSRPVTSPPLPWCAVERIVHSVETLCGGRWDALDPREERDTEPPAAERCRRCGELAVVSRPSLPVLPARVYRDIKPDNAAPRTPHPLDYFVPILAEPDDPVDSAETPTPDPDDFEIEVSQ